MSIHRTLAFAVLAAGALAPPAAAQAQQPTLQFDRQCYTEEQDIRYSGTGYTPNGQVDLLFARPAEPRGLHRTAADATGALNGVTGAQDADAFLENDETREEILVTANDRTRIDSGAQPFESQFGASSFTFTRWEGYSPGRYAPGRKVSVEAFGWAFAAGQPLYVQFRQGSRRRASVRAGTLDANCGDLVARVRVPRLKAGRYRIVLSTSRLGLSERYTYRSGRVTAKRSAASAASRSLSAMSRVSAPSVSRQRQAPFVVPG